MENEVYEPRDRILRFVHRRSGSVDYLRLASDKSPVRNYRYANHLINASSLTKDEADLYFGGRKFNVYIVELIPREEEAVRIEKGERL